MMTLHLTALALAALSAPAGPAGACIARPAQDDAAALAAELASLEIEMRVGDPDCALAGLYRALSDRAEALVRRAPRDPRALEVLVEAWRAELACLAEAEDSPHTLRLAALAELALAAGRAEAGPVDGALGRCAARAMDPGGLLAAVERSLGRIPRRAAGDALAVTAAAVRTALERGDAALLTQLGPDAASTLEALAQTPAGPGPGPFQLDPLAPLLDIDPARGRASALELLTSGSALDAVRVARALDGRDPFEALVAPGGTGLDPAAVDLLLALHGSAQVERTTFDRLFAPICEAGSLPRELEALAPAWLRRSASRYPDALPEALVPIAESLARDAEAAAARTGAILLGRSSDPARALVAGGHPDEGVREAVAAALASVPVQGDGPFPRGVEVEALIRFVDVAWDPAAARLVDAMCAQLRAGRTAPVPAAALVRWIDRAGASDLDALPDLARLVVLTEAARIEPAPAGAVSDDGHVMTGVQSKDEVVIAQSIAKAVAPGLRTAWATDALDLGATGHVALCAALRAAADENGLHLVVLWLEALEAELGAGDDGRLRSASHARGVRVAIRHALGTEGWAPPFALEELLSRLLASKEPVDLEGLSDVVTAARRAGGRIVFRRWLARLAPGTARELVVDLWVSGFDGFDWLGGDELQRAPSWWLSVALDARMPAAGAEWALRAMARGSGEPLAEGDIPALARAVLKSGGSGPGHQALTALGVDVHAYLGHILTLPGASDDFVAGIYAPLDGPGGEALIAAVLERIPPGRWAELREFTLLSPVLLHVARTGGDVDVLRAAHRPGTTLQLYLVRALARARRAEHFDLAAEIVERGGFRSYDARDEALDLLVSYLDPRAAEVLRRAARSWGTESDRIALRAAFDEVQAWAPIEVERAASSRRRTIEELARLADDRSGSAEQRVAAIAGLADLGALDELPRLIRWLEDENESIREAARAALGTLRR